MAASLTPTPDPTLDPTSDEVDAHVGARIRSRRQALAKSQVQLGAAIGVSFQQVQKYERGLNRVSASALYGLAAALEVEPAWFFEGLPGRPITDPVARLAETSEGRRLAEAFADIGSATHRELVIKLARALRPARADAAEAA